MTAWRGLTWDHPRGHDALAAAAAGSDLDLTWDRQPLEGFESHPIADLAARYDLLVLDHPHLGEAVATGCLLPLDGLVGAGELAAWDAATIGASMASYRLAGHQWALPLDAATQVAALRADLGGTAPSTWAQVAAQAHEVPTALSLAGPHALLTLCSVAVAMGEEPGTDPDRLLTRATADTALDLLADLAAHAPAGTAELNPIGLLQLMAGTDRVALCPLVYGYVNYSGSVTFADAPAWAEGGRHGSTLGGTGIAISARAAPDAALLDHLRLLLAEPTQRSFVPEHAGQPSARAAWTDPAVDRAAHGFYSGTARTCEQGWVRPRHAGFVPFQSVASELVRAVLAGDVDRSRGLDDIDAGWRTSQPTATAATH